MKVLSPSVTCILTSHMKPYLRDSLESVLQQTRKDLEVLVLDSGQWIGREDPISLQMAEVYADYHSHPLIHWITTGERGGFSRRTCPVAWVTNESIRKGLVRGKYVCTFYDDDRYYPVFMERMAGFLDDNSDHLAVWCTQDRISLGSDGLESPVAQIFAGAPKSSNWDCQVDGAQIMFRKEVLDQMGDPWIPEARATCSHSDGLFLEKLGAICGTVPNIPEALLAHRFTPLSTFTPSS